MGDYDHPDDRWLDPKNWQRGKWRQQVQDVPAEHVRDNGSVNWKALPEGFYNIPTTALGVQDGGRVRKKQGSALEGRIAAEGIKNPVEIGVTKHGAPQLADGNHRVNAAHNLGLPTVPARVTQQNPERMARWYPWVAERQRNLNAQQFGN